jgi:branched-chain amino acid aminotransferase
VEEFATSNFVGLKKSKSTFTYTTPLSPSVLPSITNKSLSFLASTLGWNVERRQILWDEIVSGEFEEIAAVGTAVVITPIKKIVREIRGGYNPAIKNDIKTLWDDDEPPKVVGEEVVECASGFEGMKVLYDKYRDVQREGRDEFGWMYPGEGI